jgi:hypothetical protein
MTMVVPLPFPEPHPASKTLITASATSRRFLTRIVLILPRLAPISRARQVGGGRRLVVPAGHEVAAGGDGDRARRTMIVLSVLG